MPTLQRLPLAAFVLLCLSQGVPFQAKCEDAKPATVVDEALPDPLVLHLRTGPVTETVNRVEAFLLEAARGTPVEPQLNPGMVNALIPSLTRLPVGALDRSKPIQLMLSNEGRAVMVLPVPDFKAQVTALRAAEMISDIEEGIFLVKNPLLGNAYITDAGNGLVASSEQLNALKSLSEVVGSWQQPPSKSNASAVLTVDIAKLLRLNSQKLDEGFDQMKNEVLAGAENPELPPMFQGLLRLAPDLVKQGRLLVEQVKSARVYLYPDKDVLRMSGYLTPKAETGMVGFVKSYAEATPKYDLAGYLPDHTVFLQCFHNNKDAVSATGPFAEQFVEDLISAIDSPSAKRFRELVSRSLAESQGEGALGFVPAQQGNGLSTILYYRPENPQAYKQVMVDTYKSIQPLMDIFISQIPVPLPVQFKCQYVEKAGEVNGTAYSAYRLDMLFTQPADNPLPPQIAGMIKQVQATIQESSPHFALVDDTLVQTSGPGAAEELGRAVAALKNKTLGLGAKASFAESLKAIKSKQMLFARAYLLDLIQQARLQAATMDPIQGEVIREAYQDLPSASMPVTAALGARAGKAVAGKPPSYSMKFLLNIPSAVVSETAAAVAEAEKKIQAVAGPPPVMPQPPAPVPPGDGGAF